MRYAMKKGLCRYAGYIEENVMKVLKEQAKKEERAVLYMINRCIKNYCNEIQDPNK